jgi:hypothetical protein
MTVSLLFIEQEAVVVNDTFPFVNRTRSICHQMTAFLLLIEQEAVVIK